MIAYVEDDFLVVATFQLLVQRVDVANLGGHLLPPPLNASPAQKKRHTKGRNANTFPSSESPTAAIKSKRKNPIAVAMSLSVFIVAYSIRYTLRFDLLRCGRVFC